MAVRAEIALELSVKVTPWSPLKMIQVMMAKKKYRVVNRVRVTLAY